MVKVATGKSPSEIAADAFHTHLDGCERCRTSVFNLCDVGATLLLKTSEADVIAKITERLSRS